MPYPTVEIVEECDRIGRAMKAAEVERQATLRGDGRVCTLVFHDELFRPRPRVGEFVLRRGGAAFEVVGLSVGLAGAVDDPLVLWELREPGSIESIEVSDKTLLAEYEKVVPIVDGSGHVLGVCGTLKPGPGIELPPQASDEAPRVLRESNPPNASELYSQLFTVGEVMAEVLESQVGVEAEPWREAAASLVHMVHIAEGGQP